MMNFSEYHLVSASAEIFIGVMACVILLLGLFLPRVRHLPYLLTQITLIVAMLLIWHSYMVMPTAVQVVFSQGFILDHLAVTLKLLICLTVLLVFVFSRQYNNERHLPSNEFYVLGLIATLGMLVLVSGYDLISLYLGIELLSLPSYAMVALHRSKTRCIEAAMKYFIIGSLASGILLYGLSILFGITKSLDIHQIAKVLLAGNGPNEMLAIFALVFIVAGIAFKLGAAPFHVWVPDVYDGAPNSVTLFISTAPKIAAFALLIRLLVDSMPALTGQWQQVLLVMAVISIALGNLVAIVQVNIKRMLAYSSIAHIGYMLLGIACGTDNGNAAALFYIISYALMTVGAFGMVILMSHSGIEANLIEDFAGLNSRNPWLALMMMLVMFSLAGMPPLIGFIAKVGIFEALIEAHLTWLAVVAILFAIIGSYYYIRVIKVMYFEEPSHGGVLNCPLDATLVMSLTGFAVLLIGIFPGALFHLCHAIF